MMSVRKLMTITAAHEVKPYAGNPHIRFGAGNVAPAATLRHRSILGKVKTVIVAMLALLSVGRLYAVTYDAVNPPSASISDENGIVSFEYGDNNQVAKIVLAPNPGSTLVLDGDAIPFAAGAKIVVGQGGDEGGESVIAGGFTAVGALEFVGITNLIWEDSEYLPQKSETTVFRGVRLDDVMPLSGRGTAGNKKGLSYAAYNIARDGDAMRFELQYNNPDINTRGMFLELKQVGDDITCKYLTGGITNGNHLGIQMFTYENGKASALGNVTVANYANNKPDMLTVGPRSGKRSSLTFSISDAVDLPAVSGSGVSVTFESASPNAEVNANGANTMVDGAYVIRGNAACPIVFRCVDRSALPDGTTDCYGDVAFHTHTFQSSLQCDNKSAIAMHSGARLYQAGYAALGTTTTKQEVLLDAATLYAQWNNSNWSYCDHLTISNGSSVAGGEVRAGYASGTYWRVNGNGMSVCDADIRLVGYETALRELTVDVEDTVSGEAPDFLFNGDIVGMEGARHHKAAIVKTGAGTMLMNGGLMYTNSPTRVVEGTLSLGGSGVTAGEHGFSLDGGTLALAAGTANTAATVAVTADSTLKFGDGSALFLTNLMIAEGKTLLLSGVVPRKGLKVETALDDATLARIRFADSRSRKVVQTGGYVHAVKGFVIILR